MSPGILRRDISCRFIIIIIIITTMHHLYIDANNLCFYLLNTRLLQLCVKPITVQFRQVMYFCKTKACAVIRRCLYCELHVTEHC